MSSAVNNYQQFGPRSDDDDDDDDDDVDDDDDDDDDDDGALVPIKKSREYSLNFIRK